MACQSTNLGMMLLGFPTPNFTQVPLQQSSLCLWLKPHQTIKKLVIVTALGWQLLFQTWKKLLCQKWVLYKVKDCFLRPIHAGGQKLPTQSQPRSFSSWAQRWPRCLHPSEATSQDESFMPARSDIAAKQLKHLTSLALDPPPGGRV